MSPSWWLLEPSYWPAQVWYGFELGKTKPETSAADGTLLKARAHAVGVRVV